MFKFLKRDKDKVVKDVSADAKIASENKSDENIDSNAVAAEPAQKTGLFSRLRNGLSRTRANLSEGVARIILGKKTIDASIIEDIETSLLTADVGVEATSEILRNLEQRLARKEISDPAAVLASLQQNLAEILEPCDKPLNLSLSTKPYVILMAGVNGVGKTTTIGKLAKRLQSEGKKVMLAAGDTYRAAAIEQLQVWGERNKISVIAQQSGADSASVIFDAIQAATARDVDVLIADTAGRLHTQLDLMDELKKIKRVMAKIDAEMPHEIMMAIDAGTGQNALSQVQQFNEAIGVTGLCLTKLDGTAKGGIVFALAKRFALPIRFIGIGEGIEDLRPFVAKDFIAALFN